MFQKDSFIHHVYFWLVNSGSNEDRNKLVEGLKKLSAVSTIENMHVGVAADTSRAVVDSTYAVSLLLVFKNVAAQDSYQVDPIHLEFVATCKHLWSKVIVYDTIGL